MKQGRTVRSAKSRRPAGPEHAFAFGMKRFRGFEPRLAPQGHGRNRALQLAGLLSVGLLAGCGNQSTLSPASDASRDISSLWWWMLIGAAVVFAVVLALLVLGLLRRQGLERNDRRPIGSATWLVATGGLVVPLVVFVVLFAATLGTLPTTSAAGRRPR